MFDAWPTFIEVSYDFSQLVKSKPETIDMIRINEQGCVKYGAQINPTRAARPASRPLVPTHQLAREEASMWEAAANDPSFTAEMRGIAHDFRDSEVWPA